LQTHVQYAHFFRRESYVGQVGRSGVELTSLVGAWLVVLVVLLGLQGAIAKNKRNCCILLDLFHYSFVMFKFS
jgi:hypothetical protein